MAQMGVAVVAQHFRSSQVGILGQQEEIRRADECAVLGEPEPALVDGPVEGGPATARLVFGVRFEKFLVADDAAIGALLVKSSVLARVGRLRGLELCDRVLNWRESALELLLGSDVFRSL